MAFNPIRFFRKWTTSAEAVRDTGTLVTRVPMGDDEVRATWLLASWLMAYPDEDLYAALPRLEGLLAGLPAEVSDLFRQTLTTLRERDEFDLRSEFVDTFDTRKRGCLYLTYFAHGDTRKRGMALLDIKQTYRAAGLEVSEDELPDHLTYVLEFGAGHDLHAGAQILLKNRAGLELLRLHLEKLDSPWCPVIRAVCLTLPPLDGDDHSAIARLAEEGPAQEAVGLSDGAEDMPPGDMSPYAINPYGPDHAATQPDAGCGVGASAVGAVGSAGSPAFVPLTDVKGLRS